ncbi:MAG: HAD-IIA family hydrolase [Actinomycetia bacterium]|nr:HAD-IIA family hydrolase [Actinomycetes bacterium]
MLAWAIDLDGVVWRGAETVPGAPEAVARLRRADCPIAFVTNSALRTPDQVGVKLADHGIPDATDLVITSAMAAASLIEEDEKVVMIGSDGLRGAIEDRKATVVEEGPADAVIVGLSYSFDYADMTRAMEAIRGGARFIATNDDSTFPDADRLLPGNGAIVAAVATAAGVAPVIAGKPHETISATVRARLGTNGIMVGDRPETDGSFARTIGYQFGLVLTGVTSIADLPVSPSPDIVEPDLATLVDVILGPGLG